MRLKHKLIVIVLTVCTGSFAVCAGFFAVKTNAFTVRMATENNVRQLEAKDYVFSQMVTDTRFDAMGDIAMEAYLKYQFRRCFGEGYALLKNQDCLVNLTEFEILDPSLYRGDYMIQHLKEGQTALMMERAVSAFPDYRVLLVQDITAYERETAGQMREYLIACCGILAAAAAVLYGILGKVLRPLGVLTEAAQKLGEGDLKVRVLVKGKDEMGVLAQAFNQMAGQVEGQVEDLRLLLGALTHEIKTPMTTIIGYGESLLCLKLTKEQQEHALKGICRGGRRLERLCGKLLAMVGMYAMTPNGDGRCGAEGRSPDDGGKSGEIRDKRAEEPKGNAWEHDAGAENSGQINRTGEICLEPAAVEDMFREAAEELSPFTEEREIKIILEVEGEPVVNADRELFVSLLCNLIHNSVKASRPGGRIWLEADSEKLTVRDEGSGIPAEDLPHVWEAFFMADKSRSRSEGGSGLGLALADRIVKLHGMRADIESQVGIGTVVRVFYGKM